MIRGLNILCPGVGDSEFIVPTGIHFHAHTVYCTRVSGGYIIVKIFWFKPLILGKICDWHWTRRRNSLFPSDGVNFFGWFTFECLIRFAVSPYKVNQN